MEFSWPFYFAGDRIVTCFTIYTITAESICPNMISEGERGKSRRDFINK